ncbi:uncharacterized protein [Dysidea avara]|uniref:uncharacterized protein isoform X2 n=1 Tax=Dysidea avara TaxID=196820 RepID=UPI00331E8B99
MLSSVFTFPVLCLLVLTAAHLSVSQLTDEDKQLLLDLHNRARSMVYPIATNMEEMEWNDELAGVAQAYSTKCTTQPNGDRASQAKSFITVGENLGTISPPSSASYSALFETWFKGNLLYNYTTGKCIIKGICDSYKQLVWATSNQLGCGATRCSSVEGSSITGSSIVVVCNYGPSGNLEGKSPYMTGDSSCSNCPADKKSCVNNLCSNALSVSQLTDEDKQLLLDLHNRARSMVDPIATNMEEMEWNDELAGVAQAYSTKCTTQPNPNRTSQAPSFSTVGESSGVSMPPSSESFGQVVGFWFNGRHLYNYTTGQCFRDQFCDSYTQLVWATSNQVGCGATRCNPVGGFVGEALLLVCNYAPSEKLEGQSPYMTGDSSCSNCPDDKKSCVNNLCSNVSCPVLDPPNNGMIDCTSNEVGSTCTFKCNTGFELTGSASQTCQYNGTWSGTETTCTPDCSADEVTIDDVSVAGGTATVEFSSDPNARFRCKLNSQRSRPCTSPVTYTGLSRGRHRVTIQAVCPGKSFRDGARKRARFGVS